MAFVLTFFPQLRPVFAPPAPISDLQVQLRIQWALTGDKMLLLLSFWNRDALSLSIGWYLQLLQVLQMTELPCIYTCYGIFLKFSVI